MSARLLQSLVFGVAVGVGGCGSSGSLAVGSADGASQGATTAARNAAGRSAARGTEGAVGGNLSAGALGVGALGTGAMGSAGSGNAGSGNAGSGNAGRGEMGCPAMGGTGSTGTGGAPGGPASAGMGADNSSPGGAPSGGTAGSLGVAGGTTGGTQAGGAGGFFGGVGGSARAGAGGLAMGGTGSGGTSGAGGAAGAGETVDVCTLTTPLSGGTAQCSSGATGRVGNQAWNIWSSGNGGCITPYGVGAAFRANWSNSGDFLARVGLKLDGTKTFEQYGTISAEFAFAKAGTGGPYSYIGVFGGSNSPNVEYYIVEDWFGASPISEGDLQGTLTVDGGTYKIYKYTSSSHPTIDGTPVTRFYSIRQTRRPCGHVSVTEHFKKWTSLGMKLGKLLEAMLFVEAGGGLGSIDFTAGSVTAK